MVGKHASHMRVGAGNVPHGAGLAGDPGNAVAHARSRPAVEDIDDKLAVLDVRDTEGSRAWRARGGPFDAGAQLCSRLAGAGDKARVVIRAVDAQHVIAVWAAILRIGRGNAAGILDTAPPAPRGRRQHVMVM